MLHLRFRIVATTLALACFAVSGLTGCQTNPATGGATFNMLSEQEEIQIGSDAQPQFIQQYGGEVPDPQLQSYISNLGNRLASVSERPELPWEFHAVDSSVINAFALPGGKIFITRGLLSRMDNEAQLAAVLGHEIGHVTGQHIGQQMTQAMILQTGIAILGAAAGEEYQWAAVLGGAGGQFYLLSFGRGQETEADTLGTRYMAKLNYDPKGMRDVMEILAEVMGDGRQPEYFSTHPHPETRIKSLNQLYSGKLAHTQNNPKFVTNAASFQRNALDRLKALPAPRHNPQADADFEDLRDAHAWLEDEWERHGHHHHRHDHLHPHDHPHGHHHHPHVPERPIIIIR